ncbi:hypothetical protein BKA70DRAFT_1236758 [Coprinopsis sp. MPI-PUGE-AT-0042]|nr:hypothetical protein BKA70DRAFT_1236758 [Coprinopsis sp. MPI-PUGE-AT-0042]
MVFRGDGWIVFGGEKDFFLLHVQKALYQVPCRAQKDLVHQVPWAIAFWDSRGLSIQVNDDARRSDVSTEASEYIGFVAGTHLSRGSASKWSRLKRTRRMLCACWRCLWFMVNPAVNLGLEERESRLDQRYFEALGENTFQGAIKWNEWKKKLKLTEATPISQALFRIPQVTLPNKSEDAHQYIVKKAIPIPHGSPVMKKWTEEYENSLEFLAGLIPDYLEAQEKKKPLKDGFYPDVKQRFKSRFNVTPTDAEIAKFGNEQAAQMADKRLLNRISSWFPNNTRPGSTVFQPPRGASTFAQDDKTTIASGERRSRQKFSRSCIKIMPAQRLLQSTHAYQLLYYKDEVKDAQVAAREEYLEQCKKDGTSPSHAFAFRNQWLRDRFESESNEVKAKVEEYRLSTKPAVDDETPEERNMRYARNIAKVPKTLEGIGQSIANETGWFASMVIGGPHPAYGGKVVTFSRHYGKTRDGNTYEEFLGAEESARQLSLFDDFLLAAFDASNCKDYICDTKEGPVVYDGVSDQSDDDDDDDDDGDTSQSTTRSPKNNCSAVAQLSEYELEKERNIARNNALLAELGLSGGASKTIKAAVSRQNQETVSDQNEDLSSGLATASDEGDHDQYDQTPKKPDSIDAQGQTESLTPLPSCFPAGGPQLLETPTAHKPATPLGGTTSTTPNEVGNAGGSRKPTPPLDFSPGELPSLTGSRISDEGESRAPDPIDTNIGGPGAATPAPTTANLAAPSNGSTAGPGKDVGAEPTSELVAPAHVTAALWEYLSGIDTKSPWQDLLQAYLKFEASSPPHSSMPTTMCPAEVGSWMKRHHKAGTPKDVDATAFGPRLLAWWHSLQPDERLQSSSSPASYKREGLEAGIWESLRKGGANGLVLIVISLGWWISAHGIDNDPPASLSEVLEDVTWVLGHLSTSSVGGEVAQDLPRGKRKASGGEISRSKRLVLPNVPILPGYVT